jgi:probable 2-oxoglutarate dehydrogenase E1 component DHKTD1
VATPPQGFSVHDRLLRAHVQTRRAALQEAEADPSAMVLDWATCEAMAIGATLVEGRDVRIAGQDTRRGTFSHRHAALVCQESDAQFVPMNESLRSSLADARVDAADVGQVGTLHVVSSNLSEFACLGFEYGYSLESPRPLVLWEAQFGDFANGAQIVVDNFIASGETKWLRQSGLTLLLPHEFAGAGPEHSTCRIERFLQLSNSQAVAGGAAPWAEHMDKTSAAVVAADRATQSRTPTAPHEDLALSEAPNWAVANPSTPAQYFHLLRRQTARAFRKPLVVAAPKTLLKLRECRSSLLDLAAEAAGFHPVLDDPSGPAKAATERVLLCSGRIFYLLDARRTQAASGELGDVVKRIAERTAIIRVEELSPFPTAQVRSLLDTKYDATDIVWVQEEPANAGAWAYAAAHLTTGDVAGTVDSNRNLSFVGRPALAASAAGISTYDKAQFEATVLGPAFSP